VRVAWMSGFALQCIASAVLASAPRAGGSAGVAVPSRGDTIASAEPSGPASGPVHLVVSGDSDGDLADTSEADPTIRAIRIIRSPVSQNPRPTLSGKHGQAR
jgi:hypothetical protein